MSGRSEIRREEVDAVVIAWWESKRPAMWNADEHAQDCFVNTTTEAERRLAWVAAGLVVGNMVPLRLTRSEPRP